MASKLNAWQAATGSVTSCAAGAPGEAEGAGLLLIAHADTVHPVGTLGGKLSVRREGTSASVPPSMT